MDTETIENEKNILIRKQKSKKVFFEQKGEESRLDCIYDNSPLGFEKPISLKLKKMESQDPLEEINLRTKVPQFSGITHKRSLSHILVTRDKKNLAQRQKKVVFHYQPLHIFGLLNKCKA